MARPAAGRLCLSVLLGCISIAASLGFVAACKSLVDIATGHSDSDLGRGIIIMFGILLVRIISSIAHTWWENYISIRTRNELQKRYFSHVLDSRWNGREIYHSGDLTNRLEEDVRVLVDLICSRIPNAIVTIVQLIAASIFLMSMEPRLLWMLLALMVVGVLGSKLFFKVLRTLTSEIRKADSRIQQIIQENLQNRVLVLTMTGSLRIIRKLETVQESLERLTIRRQNYNAVARSFMSLAFNGGYAAAFLWGVFGITNGTVSFGMMTAFLQLVGQVQRPVADLSLHIPAFIHALTSAERLLEIDDMELNKEDDGILLDEAPAILFSHVDFRYEGQKEKTLDDFSYTFAAGALTAIMGPTGAGKSTVIRLALGLLDPDSGEVSRYARRNYMYVPQGNSLMSGTIRENLLMADPGADENKIREALHTAAADFVLDLPEGLDSRCGEVGSGLSEGQAQRIAVARALLHEGGILILDEATSALDAKTEERLLENLIEKYRGRKTILFVSHRDKVFDMADAICHIKS